jgi:hypothetical protein
MVLTAGVYKRRCGVEQLSHGAYSSSMVNGEAGDGSLERIPPRLVGGACPEEDRAG